jgi:tetratricopeptide (TPR) repeat protein
MEFNELAMGLADKIGPRYILRTLLGKAVVEWALGEYHKSIQYCREAQRLARLTSSLLEECLAATDEAAPWCHLGAFMNAQACIAQGHELLLQAGLQGSDRELQIMDLTADIHFYKSEYAQAREVKHRMVQMTSRHRSPHFHANALQELAQIDIIIGSEDSLVIENLSAAKELSTQLGWAHGGMMSDLNQCQLDIRAGKGVEVYPTLVKLVKAARSLAHVLGCSLEVLGNLLNGLCGVADKFRWAITYFAFARNTKDLSHTYQALRYVGDLFLAEGDEQSAMNVFQAVLDASTEMDVHRRRADCMSRIGDILLRQGQIERAKTMWKEARPLFLRSSRAQDVDAIDTKLANLTRGRFEAPRNIV